MDSALISASFCHEQETRWLHGVAAHVANLTTPRTVTHSIWSASAAVDDVPSRLTCGVPYDVVPEIAGIVTGQVLRDDHVRIWLLTCGVLAWGWRPVTDGEP